MSYGAPSIGGAGEAPNLGKMGPANQHNPPAIDRKVQGVKRSIPLKHEAKKARREMEVKDLKGNRYKGEFLNENLIKGEKESFSEENRGNIVDEGIFNPAPGLDSSETVNEVWLVAGKRIYPGEEKHYDRGDFAKNQLVQGERRIGDKVMKGRFVNNQIFKGSIQEGPLFMEGYFLNDRLVEGTMRKGSMQMTGAFEDGQLIQGEIEDGDLHMKGSFVNEQLVQGELRRGDTVMKGSFENGKLVQGELQRGEVIRNGRFVNEQLVEGWMKSGGIYMKGSFKQGQLVKGEMQKGVIVMKGSFSNGQLLKGTMKRGDEFLDGDFQRGELSQGTKTLSDGTYFKGKFLPDGVFTGLYFLSDEKIFSGVIKLPSNYLYGVWIDHKSRSYFVVKDNAKLTDLSEIELLKARIVQIKEAIEALSDYSLD